jgi:NAD(P)-dependent dehydrogenase (short-subunit alcohol dehydrogenase family)
LAAVIGFVYDNAEGLEAPTTATAAAVEGHVAATVAPSGLIAGDDQAAAAIPRRFPTPVLRPHLDLCAPTEVTLGPGSKVLVMLDEGGVGGALVKRLEKDHVDVLAVEGAPSAEELMSRIDAWAGDDRVQGVYWLPALDVEAPMGDMDLIAWKEALRIRVKLLYATMRHLYDQVAEPGTFLVSATRLGGRHGYDDAGPPAPMGGAVTGFTKAYKRERPDALVKAVDFPLSRKTTALAKTLVAETLRDPGAVEVGWQDDRRFTITLTEQPLPDPASGLDLGPESVFVVTGAAGSIVSAITADLARASGGTFHLLDLVPEPDPGDPDVALFSTDRDALKRLIFERLKDSGERATPAMVDRELVGIERAAAALDAIHAVEAAGGTVHYHSVNLLDAAAMGSVTGKIAEINGKVDVLLHAGGLEISRALPDKEPGEYDLVFDVKADGWFNLLSGLADVPIAATVAFSSIAGRFGNAGQTDYSAANDLLCKSGLAFRTTRPETSGIATDWTAWGDIGMATRGSIPTVMNAAGIDMLPAVAGIPIVRRELAGAAGSRELVVGLRLGALQEEWDETGGLDVGAVDLDAAAAPVMVGDVRGFGIHDGLTVTTQLDPTEQAFLFDHQREGTPILPGVMGVESFAAVAALAFPDRHVTAVEDVEFLAPFKFYRNEPRELTIRARFRADGDDILADCELVGERTLANQQEPQVTTHFTGKVRLASSSPKLRKQTAPKEDAATAAGAGDIYDIFFHGPAYQVLDSAWRSGEGAAGLFSSDLPDDYTPQERTTVTEPRLVELCFQTAGIWEIASTGTMGLPMHIDRVVPVKGVDRAKGRIFASVRQDEHGFSADVVDESGAVLVTMEGYRTAQIPEAMDDDLVAPLRNAMEDR